MGKDVSERLCFDEFTIGYVVRYPYPAIPAPHQNNRYVNNRYVSVSDKWLYGARAQNAVGLPSLQHADRALNSDKPISFNASGLPSLQHADCILNSGEPITFIGSTGESNFLDMKANGHIIGYKMLHKLLKGLVDVDVAVKEKLTSQLLIIQVPQKNLSKVRKFHAYWDNARNTKELDQWEKFDNNCSVFVHNAFIEAGFLRQREANFFDTPASVYDRLARLLPKDYQLTHYLGYLGFEKRDDYPNKYCVLIQDKSP